MYHHIRINNMGVKCLHDACTHILYLLNSNSYSPHLNLVQLSVMCCRSLQNKPMFKYSVYSATFSRTSIERIMSVTNGGGLQSETDTGCSY